MKTKSHTAILSAAQMQPAVYAQKTTLSNGLRIVSEYVPTVASFALGAWVNAGSRDESDALAGTAHFIEHLIFRRSLRHSARAIAAAFEDIGAYTNAFTTKEHTCFYARALGKHFRKCAALLGEIVSQPAFHPADIEKERSVILEEIKGYDDEPEERIFDEAESSIFAGNSLAHPIAGSTDSVVAITTDDIAAFYRSYYRPENMVIAVAGNITHEKAVAAAEAYFKFDATANTTKTQRTPIANIPGGRVTESKQFQQSHIVTAARLEGADSPDRFAYSVLNAAFGDGMSSRLYQRLRERSALAYTVYSTVQLMSDCGLLAVYAGVDARNTDKALRCIAEEIDKLRETAMNRKEIARAKEQVKTGIVMGLEDMSSRMNYLAKSEIEEGGFEPAEIALAKIDAVESSDILRIAQTRLTHETIKEVVFRALR